MDDSLKNLLQALHGKLEAATSVEAEDRELLKRLAADIRAVLARSGEQADAKHESLSDQLEAVAIRFEGSHPDVTAAIMQVSKTLGDMGI